MVKLKYSEYLKTDGAFQVSDQTFRRYIEKGVIPGERTPTGRYYAHVGEQAEPLAQAMYRG